MKKIISFFRKYYFIQIILVCVVCVLVIAFSKSAILKPQYIYVKIKMGEGSWWAQAGRPNIWYINSLKKDDVGYDLLGNTQAQILDVKHYRWYGSDQFDVFVTIKLRINKNKKTKQYIYNRSAITVSSPIDIQLADTDISGTVIQISDVPYKENYVNKTVILTKRYAFPWEYDAIHIGDTYSDGNETVFKVIDKQKTETTSLSADTYGNATADNTENRNFITVKAQVKVKESGGQLIFGEDQVLTVGGKMNASTSHFIYADYYISDIY